MEDRGRIFHRRRSSIFDPPSSILSGQDIRYRRTAYLLPDPLYLRILVVAVDIDLRYATAGQDIVELVEQDQLPAGVKLLLPVQRSAGDGPGVEPLGLAVEELGGAVGLLGARLTGVGATMVFEVQLTDPARQAWVIPYT